MPTEDLVRAACKEFDRDNRVIEEALRELFGQYPRNGDLRHVLLKCVALNALYSTQIPVHSEKIPNVVNMAEHIQRNSREIDGGVADGSPGVVDKIANIAVPGKPERCNCSFATKYCSWHKPEAYPIWDSHVLSYLSRLQEQTGQRILM
jgi:hypothetical protein